jgi:uncharacterized membrane protein
MAHQWLNVIHLITGMVWLGGLLMMAVVVVACGVGTSSNYAPLIGQVRRWSRSVTSPAMLILWACGLAMIISHGGGLPLWLILKIAVLVLLSGVHGMLSATLRRLAEGQNTPLRPFIRYTPWIVVLATVLIVLFVKMGHVLG